jgi:hypothetical protein
VTADRATDLDLARARAEGTLEGPARLEVERRLRDDPAFARLVALYADVLEATPEVLPPRPARPSPSFADARPRLLSRPLALAAAAVVLAALGALSLRLALRPATEGGGTAVVLRAIPLEPVADATPPDAPLPALSRYAPAGAVGVRFVDGYEQGLALARASGKPLLLFLYAPECPLCVEVASGPLLDDRVGSAVEPFVVARQDVSEAPKSLVEGLRHLPSFAVYTPAGARESLFAGALSVSELSTRLEVEAAMQVDVHGASPSWQTVRALAGDLAAAEEERDPARRRATWERTAAADPTGPLGGYARARLRGEKEAARQALLAAKEAASSSGAAAALARLDEAIRHAAGSPYEADLRAVRERVEETGTFPALEAAP